MVSSIVFLFCWEVSARYRRTTRPLILNLLLLRLWSWLFSCHLLLLNWFFNRQSLLFLWGWCLGLDVDVRLFALGPYLHVDIVRFLVDAVVVIVVRLVFAGVWAISLRCSAFVLEVIVTIVEVVIVVEVPAGIVVVIAIVEISAGVVIAVVIIAVVKVVIIVVIGDLDFVVIALDRHLWFRLGVFAGVLAELRAEGQDGFFQSATLFLIEALAYVSDDLVNRALDIVLCFLLVQSQQGLNECELGGLFVFVSHSESPCF